MFDGESFIKNLSIERTLNYLIYEKEIPPCITVAIDHVNRLDELTYNDRANAFLTARLLPWLQARYHVYQEAKHTTIAGFRRGGLAAFYAALRNPYILGNVLSLSEFVHWKKDGFEKVPWTEHQILSSNLNASHLKFHMITGQLENEPLLTVNKRLYRALKDKG